MTLLEQWEDFYRTGPALPDTPQHVRRLRTAFLAGAMAAIERVIECRGNETAVLGEMIAETAELISSTGAPA